MKLEVTFFTLLTFCSFGQTTKECFRKTSPYVYGVAENMSIYDSTFEYSYVFGLMNGRVKGDLKKFDDTLILNSEFQEDDYTLEKSFEANRSSNSILIKIKFVGHPGDLDLRAKTINDSVTHFIGKRNIDNLKEPYIHEDTITLEYEIDQTRIISKVLELSIWSTNSQLLITVDNQANTYKLDLTKYPNTGSYHFFKDKKAIIKGDKFFILDENNKPIRDTFAVLRLKGISTSKRKKRVYFVKIKC